LSSETHGSEDVGVYASGPQSHLFSGTYEQSNLPILMAYAAKIGPYKNENEFTDAPGTTPQVSSTTDTSSTTTTDSASTKSMSILIITNFFIILKFVV
jgi:hypothetical protein